LFQIPDLASTDFYKALFKTFHQNLEWLAFVVVLLLPLSLSSLPFGVIFATIVAVVTIVDVVLVAPDAVALAAFVVILAVIATTVFAVAVTLVVDSCVPLPSEEDHCLPPPSGNVPS
jgi:hypothetical protein